MKIEIVETKLVVIRGNCYAADFAGDGWTDFLPRAAKWDSDLTDSAERVAKKHGGKAKDIIVATTYSDTLEVKA